MEKKAFICCFPVEACSNLATHRHEFHCDGRQFVIATSIITLIEGCALFIVAIKAFYRNRGSLFPLSSFSSIEHKNAFAMSCPRGDPIAMPSIVCRGCYETVRVGLWLPLVEA